MARFLPAAVAAALVPALAALFAAGPAAVSAAEPAAPQKIVSIEGVTEYRLDNGLKVVLFPDPSASTVTVNLTILVGSRHEGLGETGMAHLLEHMVFKGTPKHPDVPKALRDHGASFNGTTWVDRTNYFETMPASDENLEFGIALEADRMVNSLIRGEDLASEMTVVRNEFEQGENSPDRILSERVLSAAYLWHNYGKSTIGNRSDIERVPVENLRVFYRKYYQPDNAVLVVAGKFEEAKALSLVQKHFGPLPKPERKLSDTYTEEPAQDGERLVTLRRVGTTPAVEVGYHVCSGAHPDMAALEILADVLDDEPTGRLYTALVQAKKAARVQAFPFSWHDPGMMMVGLGLEKDADPVAAKDALLAEIDKVVAEGKFTAEEVERAKRKRLNAIEQSLTKSNSVGIALSNWIGTGDWRLFFLHRDRLAKVTSEDVARVAAKYLVRNNRTVGVFIPTQQPERATVPATPPIADALKDYKGGKAAVLGEAFDPTPENIEKRVTRGTLEGTNLKTALLPRKTRGEMAIVQLNLRYGNPDSLRGLTDAADFMEELLPRGTKTKTRKQIQDEFDKLNARFSVGGQPGLLSVSLQVKRENLAAALKLVGEVLREPSFPADEFEVLKRQTLEGLQKQLTEPPARASNLIQRTLSPYPPTDVRYIPTLEENIARIEAVKLDQVVKLYKEQVGGAVGELVMVGDFDPAAADIVAGFVKGWTSPVEWQRVPRPANTSVPGGRETIDTPDKANAVYIAAVNFAMKDDDPDYPALKLGSFIFGEASLASRLSNRVRGKDGLSYGVGGRVQASPIDPSAGLMMFAIYNPANAEKVDKAIAEELAKMLKEGVTAEEVASAKKAFLEQLKTGRGSDAAIAGMLGNGLFVGRTMDYYIDLEKKIAALTPEAVSETFRKRIDPSRLFIVQAGDFKKAAEKGEKKDEKDAKK
jgi:zinc protease